MIIREIELLCKDLTAAEKFYSGVLGLEIVKKETGCISFRTGTSFITFITAGSEEPVYHFAFNITPGLIHEALSWIQARGKIICPDGEPIVDFPNWNAKSVYFYDAAGNILEFIARFDIRDTRPAPFTAKNILCVSEIGVATPELKNLVREISETHGVLPYARQPVLRHFAALGDEHGLFIVSEAGRNWFPAGIPSKPFYTRVKYSIHQIAKEVTFNDNSTPRGA
jgi:catechol-2,3-dioxygenase